MKRLSYIKQYLLLVALIYPSFSSGLVLIFDLGEVLVTTHALTAFWHIGYKPFLWYLLYNPHKIANLSTHLRYNCLYPFLNSIESEKKHTVPSRDERGILIPPIMCDWLTGTSSEKILEKIYKASETYPFHSETEKAVLLSMMKMMFTPSVFVTTQRLIPEMEQCVRRCKQQGDHLYILSNWHAESFELFRKQHAEFFALFDGIILSGTTGVLKPDPAIYNHLLNLLNKNHVSHEPRIFFDDRIENLQTAQSLGIPGILVTKDNRAHIACSVCDNQEQSPSSSLHLSDENRQ